MVTRDNNHKKLKVDIITPIRFGGTRKWGGDLVRALNSQGVEAINIHSFFGFLKRIFYTDADLIHSALPLPFNLQGKPIILTIHGNYKKERNISNFLRPIAIRNAKIITVPSKFLKDEIGLKKAVVVPNGIFIEDYKRKKVKRHSRIINLVTITNFSFWEKARGVLDLFEVLNELKKKTDKKFTFTVVGGGRYLKKIKDQSKNYEFPIIFTGFHRNPKDILDRSDLFLYYSYQDTFGIVLLEAMACGLPTVSNDFGPTKEIIDKNLVCNNRNEMVKIVELLINNPKKRSLIIHSNKKKVMRFSWENITWRILKLYGQK